MIETEAFPLLDLEEAKVWPGYAYLATPYSLYPHGLEEAFRSASRAASILIGRGVKAYSPIVHSHPVAIHGGLDPLDHTIWLTVDLPLMQSAHALIVCMMEGWRDSYGIGEEIKEFQRLGKPIRFMEWPHAGR